MEQQPVTAIIVGAGHRAFVYSKLALTNPELLKIVGVADPDPIRRKKAMDMFGFRKKTALKTQTRFPAYRNLPTPSSTAQWTISTLKRLCRF